MNIKQCYHTTATIYLNISLFTVALSIILFTVNLTILDKHGIWGTTIPFMFISCVYFVCFLIYKKRYQSIPGEISASCTTPLEERDVLLAFMPAPTLRVLLFNEKGKLLGEINDSNTSWYNWIIPNSILALMPNSYVLTDSKGNILATFEVNGWFSNDMSFYDEKGNQVGNYQEDWKQSLVRYKGTVRDDDGSIRMTVDISGFLQSFIIPSEEGKMLVSYQKGWMPLEWAERFKLNTPILTFTNLTTKEDRLCIYGLCARLLSHCKN
ncbi:hypothetical protein [Bacillus sp. JJ722]|uniref:hypothetical protein n=1 Tax=Bacillus sp. JJ722 TaxID=3122973 RepID=UPI002FFE44A1